MWLPLNWQAIRAPHAAFRLKAEATPSTRACLAGAQRAETGGFRLQPEGISFFEAHAWRYVFFLPRQPQRRWESP